MSTILSPLEFYLNNTASMPINQGNQTLIFCQMFNVWPSQGLAIPSIQNSEYVPVSALMRCLFTEENFLVFSPISKLYLIKLFIFQFFIKFLYRRVISRQYIRNMIKKKVWNKKEWTLCMFSNCFTLFTGKTPPFQRQRKYFIWCRTVFIVSSFRDTTVSPIILKLKAGTMPPYSNKN